MPVFNCNAKRFNVRVQLLIPVDAINEDDAAEKVGDMLSATPDKYHILSDFLVDNVEREYDGPLDTDGLY